MRLHKSFSIVILLLTLLFQVKAQTFPALDELSINEIEITRTTGADKGGVFKLAGTPENLISAFGKPQSTTTEYSEIEDRDMTVYTYKGAKFYFFANALTGFQLTGSEFNLRTPSQKGTGKFTFKVGDAGSKVQTVYPKSYKALNEGKIFISLFIPAAKGATAGTTSAIVYMDDMLVMVLDNGVITDIIY